jgi:hypothetical protein
MFSPTLACRWLRDNGRPNPGVPSGPPELRAVTAILAPAAEASLLQASLVLSEIVSRRFTCGGEFSPACGAFSGQRAIAETLYQTCNLGREK